MTSISQLLHNFLHLLHTGLVDIGPFFLLLGLLIFVHELGHYLVAVYYGVRVETFSLGFGKKIFSYKRGHTNYCISIVPLGGYVKMFGDDPTAEVPESERPFAFLHKPLWPRTAIVLAGPLMNLFFAILVFAVVGMLGENVPGNQLGDISKSTPAYAAGFRSGDIVEKINGEPVVKWSEIKKYIESHAEDSIDFQVEDPVSHMKRSVTATPKLEKNDFLFSLKKKIGKIDGLTTDSIATMIGVPDPNSVAARAGLKTLDIIETVNGKPILFWRDLASSISAQKSGAVMLGVRQYNQKDSDTDKSEPLRKIQIQLPKSLKAGQTLLGALGIDRSDLFLLNVVAGTPAAKAGLKVGDEIISIDHKPIDEWQAVLDRMKSYKASQNAVTFGVVRSGQKLEFSINPELIELPNDQGGTDKRWAVGVNPAVMTVTGAAYFQQYTNPLKATVYGLQQSYEWTKLIAISFLRLVQNEVSARNIGGVITIGRVASRSFQAGMAAFLKMMSVISINLFLLNLLPIPVLDGGHLLFFSIEALKGAPLSLRKIEIAQQVGLVLLLCLMVFALFNDITHLFSSW